MDAIRNFEIRLLELNPREDSFVLEVDKLVESVPLSCQASLIPSIFRFFEKYPLEDCGAPGTLVHLTEHFYPGYKGVLLESLARAPSFNALLMVNRVLNSSLSAQEREEYFSALRAVAERVDIHLSLANEASHFISYQSQRVADN
ncbi:hypothetical protein PAQ31011_04851 [Pandoraea aquatica]|uniref:Uncharacterized protein n=1 Tax=Pandoraea aquatica TaxID=2508290 RepID=A0A5E4YXZ7_9BURK|nr:hypothetical protein [Pandoraea aquatica]VVE53205.1 hypothetical protein PAQ31011_04851 [Pandoraea aquatica]